MAFDSAPPPGDARIAAAAAAGGVRHCHRHCLRGRPGREAPQRPCAAGLRPHRGAFAVGGFSLGMARAGGEHIYSPRWYRKFQQEARERAAGSPQ